MVLDVVEGEEVVVLDDAGLGLLRVDVLQRLQDAPVAQRFVFDQHHLVDLLLPVLLGVAVLLLLLPHSLPYLNCIRQQRKDRRREVKEGLNSDIFK